MDTGDRAAMMGRIEAATVRFLDTVRALPESEAHEPSLLPGWSRGHVITHVARSGDALRELMAGARTGVPAYGYASAEAREADITTGARRPVAEQLTDVIASAESFATEAAAMTDEFADTPVRVMAYAEFPASECLLRRLVELELHHVDLGLSYKVADWPVDFATLDLHEPMRTQRADRR
ncbi:MAG TPA: maleylpyruvate isomerase N-terminal domain-containing protein [Streptosporangiaceae bacterium]|jgi:maleylpyruvate isomerase